MANNIKGITIQIGGDATGLETALKDVNASARKTQSELKEINRSLKLDPSNVELLEQKQRVLGEAVEATTSKLKTLEEAQRQMSEAGVTKKNQAQYDALTREIVNAKAALEKAKAEADGFSVSLEKAKASADKVSGAAQAVADKTKALSAAAAGLLTALGASAYKSVQLADDLNTLSKQTGISTQDLQKMSYAADLVDVSVDTIAGSMKKLRKNMASESAAAQEAFERIGVATRDANGELRDSSEVFYETLEALSQVGNETERDTLAMTIFGSSADQLAGIIDDGGAALKELGQEAEDLGIIMDQTTLDSLNAVNDEIDKLKAKATGQIAKTGAKAMEAIAPVLDNVIEKISTLLDWIGSLDEQQIQTILTIAAVVAAISPIAGIIATISGAVSSFLAIWPQVKAVGVAVKAFAAANPILLVMAAVAAAAALIYAHWDQIKPILDSLWAKVKDVFEKIREKVGAVVSAVKNTFEGLKESLTGIWESITTAIKDKVNAIIGFINSLIDKVNGFLELIGSNGVISSVAGIFGLKIGKINTIPMLAEGGVLSSGSAIVGDGGPELLTMSAGQANVQPITNTTNTYNTINQTSRQPVQINLMLDGVVAAQALYDPLKEVGAQRGPEAVRI